jgi:hypothetical protein
MAGYTRNRKSKGNIITKKKKKRNQNGRGWAFCLKVHYVQNELPAKEVKMENE